MYFDAPLLFYMQLVTPRVVAIAVRVEVIMLITIFHVSFDDCFINTTFYLCDNLNNPDNFRVLFFFAAPVQWLDTPQFPRYRQSLVLCRKGRVLTFGVWQGKGLAMQLYD